MAAGLSLYGYSYRCLTRQIRLFAPVGTGATVCSVEVIQHSRELEGQYQTKTDIVVAVLWPVVVAVRTAAVLWIIIPGAATQNTVSTL